MAFDGSAVHAIVRELQNELTDGRIIKIAQTEKEELILTIKRAGTQRKLLISASPSLPVIYLTEQSKNAPLTAPASCMLLRKHLTNGRILSISQPSMERIVEFQIEHFNEMGDICQKTLTVELMGKYSNIILRQDTKILDAIRHVSALVSSVREVLPGREYFIPFTEEKLDPFHTDKSAFLSQVFADSSMNIAKALYTNITGFSPMLAQEILCRADLDSERPAGSFTPEEKELIYLHFCAVMKQIDGNEAACIFYKNGEPDAFGTFHYITYADPRITIKEYSSISALLSDFYSQKQSYASIRQKTADLRQLVKTILNKNYKKYDLQIRQIRDTEKKEKFKLYGEILTAYGYGIAAGTSSYETVDFYTGKEITIPLDPTISAIENGKNYFKKYSKLKRTADALEEIVLQTKEEIDHLESVLLSLDIVRDFADIADLKKELTEYGYLRKHTDPSGKGSGKKAERSGKSSPLHYISSDGFHMYVGKNNYQNENLTFKIANGNDWWFHAKDIPGSHVIVKTEGTDLPDHTYEEAASLAAHYCKSEGSNKVEVQYTQKKNIKKPPAAKPGFVVFHSYYSMAASTDISGIQEVK